MTAWRDNIDLAVEIAFGYGPLDTSPVWTDVTDDVRQRWGITITRGSTSEFSPLSVGTMRLRLDNSTRTYDPDYTSGPYFGDLVPMVPIKLTATLGATAVVLFAGFVTGWPLDWQNNSDGTADVTAIDGTRFLSNVELAGSAWEAVAVADGAIMVAPLQESTGGYKDVVSARTSSGAWDLIPGTGTLPLGSSATVVANIGAGSGYLRIPSTASLSAAPKTLEWWSTFAANGATVDGAEVGYVHDTNDYMDALFTTTGVYVSYSNQADNKSTFAEIPYIPATDDHHFVLAADASNVYLYVNGRPAGTQAHTGAAFSGSLYPGLVVGATEQAGIGNAAVYPTELGQTPVTAHYVAGLHAFGHPTGERGGDRIDRCLDEIGWPVSRRDIDRGGTLQGPYLPGGQRFVDYSRQVADSERGLVFVNAAGDVVFRSRRSLWAAGTAPVFSCAGSGIEIAEFVPSGNHVDNITNVVTASYGSIGGITRDDDTSRDRYGDGRRLVQCPTIDQAQFASELAAYMVREGKDPRTFVQRLRCHMRIASGLNDFATLAAVDLGDIAEVRHTPLDIGNESSYLIILAGIQHQIGGSQWDVTLYGSPAPTQSDAAPYYTIGDATLGRVGAAYGNQVPF